jgi:hypothetical protein
MSSVSNAAIWLDEKALICWVVSDATSSVDHAAIVAVESDLIWVFVNEEMELVILAEFPWSLSVSSIRHRQAGKGYGPWPVLRMRDRE